MCCEIQKESFVAKKLVLNVSIKDFWYTKFLNTSLSLQVYFRKGNRYYLSSNMFLGMHIFIKRLLK